VIYGSGCQGSNYRQSGEKEAKRGEKNELETESGVWLEARASGGQGRALSPTQTQTERAQASRAYRTPRFARHPYQPIGENECRLQPRKKAAEEGNRICAPEGKAQNEPRRDIRPGKSSERTEKKYGTNETQKELPPAEKRRWLYQAA
jgi:hypothetical protein